MGDGSSYASLEAMRSAVRSCYSGSARAWFRKHHDSRGLKRLQASYDSVISYIEASDPGPEFQGWYEWLVEKRDTVKGVYQDLSDLSPAVFEKDASVRRLYALSETTPQFWQVARSGIKAFMEECKEYRPVLDLQRLSKVF